MKAKEFYRGNIDTLVETGPSGSVGPMTPEQARKKAQRDAERKKKADDRIREIKQIADAKCATVQRSLAEEIMGDEIACDDANYRRLVMKLNTEIQRNAAAMARILRILP